MYNNPILLLLEGIRQAHFIRLTKHQALLQEIEINDSLHFYSENSPEINLISEQIIQELVAINDNLTNNIKPSRSIEIIDPAGL